MIVHIVIGQTGEYSDHTDWPVRGFLSLEKAETFAFACTKAAKAWKKANDARKAAPDYDWSGENYAAESEAMKSAVPGDPSFRCDYTGTDYYTIKVEVEE